LELYSGNASLLSSSQQNVVRIQNQPIPFRGTLVVAGIRYAQQVDLSEALRFGGKKHVPIDFVEQTYEMDAEGNIEFNLGQESTGFGTRSAGEPVRRRLLNLARVSGKHRIIVDCGDAPLISSSYADEVVGKLFAELGAISFSQRFNFKNLDPLVEQLINKAVSQRLGGTSSG
jgi:STAS-like domain of unknown function (DUF4325)